MNTAQLTRLWDTFDAYLFDIDGTLLHCTDAVHYFAFCHVLTTVAGKPTNLDGVVAHGNTDIGILRDAFAIAGVPEQQWRSQLPWICDTMCRFVEAKKDELNVQTLPKVAEVLHHLRRKGAALGVATGNLEQIGKKKLAVAQLLDCFDFGGWSDALEYRADVFRRAVAKARALRGPDAHILVVGDTPADVQAAKSNGLPVIAVATGIYDYDTLNAEQPDRCIHSFEELAASA